MARLSISDAAQWTGGFLRREWRLIAPVAFAFMSLPGLAVQLLVPAAQGAVGPTTQMQPWMAWLLPVTILGLIGALAVSAMALVPRISVAEALTTAGRRLWVVLLAWIGVVIGLSFAIVVAMTLVFFPGNLAGMSNIALSRIGVVIALVAMIVTAARLMPLFALVAVEPVGPIAALRRSWAMTRGHGARLFGTLLLLLAAGGIVSLAVSQVLGVTALLIGRATGQEQAFVAVALVLISLVGAALGAAFYVFTTAIYRQLRG